MAKKQVKSDKAQSRKSPHGLTAPKRPRLSPKRAEHDVSAAGQNNSPFVSKHEQIALLAYSYWEKRGYQGGSPEEDWYNAERELDLEDDRGVRI